MILRSNAVTGILLQDKSRGPAARLSALLPLGWLLAGCPMLQALLLFNYLLSCLEALLIAFNGQFTTVIDTYTKSNFSLTNPHESKIQQQPISKSAIWKMRDILGALESPLGDSVSIFLFTVLLVGV